MHPILSNDARAARRPSLFLSALFSLGLSASVIAQTAPYDKVDNVGGSFVNLATFPVRPMVFDDAENLWVVNHHDSTVERFTGTTSTPNKIYGVPWQPVAIGWCSIASRPVRSSAWPACRTCRWSSGSSISIAVVSWG